MPSYVVEESHLSSQAALEIVNRAVADAVGRGVRIAVAVVDARAELLAAARMDGLPTFALENAIAKAKTAAYFRRRPDELEGFLASNTALRESLLGRADIMASKGLAPILDGDIRLGGVGVSGASPQIDQELADSALPG